MSSSLLKGFVTDVKKQTVANNHGIVNIHYKDISEAIRNRNIENIESLAEDILEDGLEQNLLVRINPAPQAVTKYELVAGHRRYKAMILLIEQGHKQFEYMPCKIVELDNIDAERRLILNNVTNQALTPSEMLDAIERLKMIYQKKKERGEKTPGRIREIIAADVGLKPTQVGTYDKIIRDGVPELKEAIKTGEISISEAAQVASLEEDDQLMFLQNQENLEYKTVKEYKESLHSNEIVDEDEYDEYDDYDTQYIDYEEEEDKEDTSIFDNKIYKILANDSPVKVYALIEECLSSIKNSENELDIALIKETLEKIKNKEGEQDD